ncbi:MAG: hypothetical protein LBT21_02670 [Oscillospiraceae bacterium]|jgi:hypothetical protein|nr:hypothetical protein [Oscillospiraceae bacterium]
MNITISPCPECGHTLASSAWRCPGCGAANAPKQRKVTRTFIAAALAIIVVYLGVVFVANLPYIIEPSQKIVYNSGTIGKHKIEILSAELKYNKKRDSAYYIYVTFRWTNGGDNYSTFSNTFDVRAFQDGEQCAFGDSSGTHSLVNSGDSVEVVVSFHRLYTERPIDISVSDWLFPKLDKMQTNKIVKTFVPPPKTAE